MQAFPIYVVVQQVVNNITKAFLTAAIFNMTIKFILY